MGSTLYLRNVPDDVVRRLELLARQTGASVSATAIAELDAVTRRADNPEVLRALPDLQVPGERIVVDIEAERAGR